MDHGSLLKSSLSRIHLADMGMAVQQRYAAGTKEVLRRYFGGEELNPTDVIVSVSFSSPFLRVLAPHTQPHQLCSLIRTFKLCCMGFAV